ncbi:conserved Plasmodium protein, unknown function [Plasmodium ovale]|uniref:Uncharacterized protein n=2 Tax=Plasmodium ovale TaxID=36330 RepID=A0A1A8WMK3_PLAOA|nr:hypothetical protein, conserved [Plasmodium ovale curtisi]SBS94118.1 hypothetical protein, conserved [Plasmodium ovale curtisi]SCP04995.1 conserved Plasmodium protein, unknown function [Plasmodium ovale]
MSLSRENCFNKMTENEMSYSNENLNDKSANKMYCLDGILENKFEKKVKEEQDMYDKNVELKKNYEDFISKKKKRAFTLGAIDGIGAISILNAPLINPENAEIEPPILQLPSATNLIKNVHLKVNFEKNIDKSYKYRTQNSNKDIIKNMKPLYSLPEKVMTYYMHDLQDHEKNEGEDQWDVETGKENCAGEDSHSDSDGHYNEEKCEAIADVSQEAVNNLKNEGEFNPREDTKPNCVLRDIRGGTVIEKGEISRCEVPSQSSSNGEIFQKGECKAFSKTTLVKKKERNKKYVSVRSKLMESNNPSENVNTLKGKIIDIYNDTTSGKNNDTLEFLELNKVMSSTLANALKALADDASP